MAHTYAVKQIFVSKSSSYNFRGRLLKAHSGVDLCLENTFRAPGVIPFLVFCFLLV
jgi:hypothetical protein